MKSAGKRREPPKGKVAPKHVSEIQRGSSSEGFWAGVGDLLLEVIASLIEAITDDS